MMSKICHQTFFSLGSAEPMAKSRTPRVSEGNAPVPSEHRPVPFEITPEHEPVHRYWSASARAQSRSVVCRGCTGSVPGHGGPEFWRELGGVGVRIFSPHESIPPKFSMHGTAPPISKHTLSYRSNFVVIHFDDHCETNN